MHARDVLGVSIALALCAAATAAAAQSRPYSPRLPCASLEALVAEEGFAVISTGPRTYDRFVHSGRFCTRTEVTEPAWVRAADSKACFVGYTCKENDRENER